VDLFHVLVTMLSYFRVIILCIFSRSLWFIYGSTIYNFYPFKLR